MPRHELEVINSLIIATEPVENICMPFLNFSRKGSSYTITEHVPRNELVVELVFSE